MLVPGTFLANSCGMKPFAFGIKIIALIALIFSLPGMAENSLLRHSIIYKGHENVGSISQMVPLIHPIKSGGPPDTFEICSGVFLAADIVLTAAHCLPKDPKGKLIVFPELKNGLNMSSLMDSEKIGTIHFVAHPDFKESSKDSTGAISDIALLKLSRPANEARIVALPSKDHQLSVKQNLFITGWGMKSYWDSEAKLRWASVMPNVDTWKESKNLKFSHFPGKNGETFCPGDSGGPTLLKTTDGLVVIGVQSGSKGCGNPLGLFHNQNHITYVPAHLDWIESVIRSWRETEI